MKKILFTLFVLGTFALGGCPKSPVIAPVPTVYDNTFTIDGGKYKNTVVNFKTYTNNPGTAGAYSVSKDNTSIIVNGTSGDSLIMGLSINFEGSKTGSYAINGGKNDYIVISLTAPSDQGIEEIYESNNAGGTIVINRYEAVGGKIGGTFSGKFNQNGTAYTIKDGAFLVSRVADTQ